MPAVIRREQWEVLENEHYEYRNEQFARIRWKHRPRKVRPGRAPIGFSGGAAIRRKHCNRSDWRVAMQQLFKQGQTRNKKRGWVFYVVQAEQGWKNGVKRPVCKQRLSKTLPRKRWRH
jgi:hypothetical protein